MIYFINGLNIQLVLICAVCCKATIYQQLAYLHTTINQVLDFFTIYNSSDLNGYETLQLRNGNQNISNNNFGISGIC